MYLYDVIVITLLVVSMVLWRQMFERAIRIDPWVIAADNTVVLNPALTWCVGDRAHCNGVGVGAAQVWTPIRINNSWTIDAAPSGSLRISASSPVVYITSAGGVVVGPVDIPGSTGTVVQMEPVSDAATSMWLSHARIAFSDGSLMDSVCHVNNAQLCGSLFRAFATDPGLFWSPTKVIFGSVDYGLIAANLRAYVIINGSMVLTQYLDRKKSVPCTISVLSETL